MPTRVGTRVEDMTAMLPRGGRSKALGGRGIFVDPDSGEGLDVWVDTDLRQRLEILYQLRENGARIVSHHAAPSASLLILSPKSVRIFDQYCHPSWLSPRGRHVFEQRLAERSVDEAWKSKVMLKRWWVRDCLAAGVFLGEAEGWGGCRAGGPIQGEFSAAPKITQAQSLDASASAKPSQSASSPAGDHGVLTPPLSAGPNSPRLNRLVPRPTGPIDQLSIPSLDRHPPPHSPEAEKDHLTQDDDEFIMAGDAIGPDKADMQANGLVNATDERAESVEAPGQGQANELAPEAPVADFVSEDRGAGMSAHIERNLLSSGAGITDHAPIPIETATVESSNFTGEQAGDSSDGSEKVFEVEDGTEVRQEEVTAQSGIELRESAQENSEPGDLVAQNDGAGSVMEAMQGEGKESPTQPKKQPKTTGDESPAVEIPASEDGMRQLDIHQEQLDDASSEIEEQIELEPVDMTVLFSGLRFWVDPTRPNRRELIQKITTSGGKVVANYGEATHVLIHDRGAKRGFIVGSDTSSETWWLDPSWVDKCISAQALVSETEAMKSVFHSRSKHIEKAGQTWAKDSYEARLPTEDLRRIFEVESKYVDDGGSIADMCRLLADKYGTYTTLSWGNLYRDWKNKAFRFKDVGKKPEIMSPNAARNKRSRSRESHSPNVGGAKKAKLVVSAARPVPSQRMSNEADSGMKEEATQEGVGNDTKRLNAKRHMTFHESPSAVASSSAAEGFSQYPSNHDNSDRLLAHHGRYSTEEIVAIFEKYAAKFKEDTSASVIGCEIAEHYHDYTARTWGNYFLEWRARRGKFAQTSGSLSNQQSNGVVGADLSSMSSAVSSGTRSEEGDHHRSRGKRKRGYTNEERIAMANYIVHRIPLKTGFRPTDWQDHHIAHPSRSASAYAQYYQTYQTVIDPLVSDIIGLILSDEEEDVKPRRSQMRAISVHSDSSSVVGLS